MSTSIKDPDATLDYTWDWEAWLDGDTIANVEVVVPDGLTLDSPATSDATTVTAWLSGGTAGDNYTVTCRVTASDGRVDDRSKTILVRQR